jgi:AraC family ethanolamine operon transcriptional activator
MVKLVCPEFDEFEEALHFVQGRYLLTERTVRDWRLRAANLGDLDVLIAHEGAANAYHGALSSCFGVQALLADHDLLSLNGERISQSTIMWLAPGEEFAFRAEGVLGWACVAIGCERVWEWLELHEVEPGSLLRTLAIPSDAATIGRLLRLIRRVLWIDARAPEALRVPQSREQATQELVDAALTAVTAGLSEAAEYRRRPHVRKQRILNRAVGLIDARIDQPIVLDDLCRTANTSRRTLHTIFAEHLGMSPHQYLMRRRLHAIHLALRTAKPSTTVTEICGQFGVWDVGRLAERYRRQFGVLPSDVLSTTRKGTIAGDQ